MKPPSKAMCLHTAYLCLAGDPLWEVHLCGRYSQWQQLQTCHDSKQPSPALAQPFGNSGCSLAAQKHEGTCKMGCLNLVSTRKSSVAPESWTCLGQLPPAGFRNCCCGLSPPWELELQSTSSHKWAMRQCPTVSTKSWACWLLKFGHCLLICLEKRDANRLEQSRHCRNCLRAP